MAVLDILDVIELEVYRAQTKEESDKWLAAATEIKAMRNLASLGQSWSRCRVEELTKQLEIKNDQLLKEAAVCERLAKRLYYLESRLGAVRVALNGGGSGSGTAELSGAGSAIGGGARNACGLAQQQRQT